jgi:hypothetical protein
MPPGKSSSDLSAHQIIVEIMRKMEQGFETLQYTCLAPSHYYVHLHPADYARLRGIFPRICDEAKRSLDERLAQLNRRPLASKLGLAKPRTYELAGAVWNIEFLEDPDKQLMRGETLVRSALTSPAKEGVRGAASTRVAGAAKGGSPPKSTPHSGPAESAYRAPDPPPRPLYGVILYPSVSGLKTFEIRKDEILIGRGGPSTRVDLVLPSPSVSKLHLRLQRVASSGQFLIESLGTYGTTVNQKTIPPHRQVPLSSPAQIGLGEDSVILEFRRAI